MYNLVVMENFGTWLRDARKEKRLTQDELAKKSGVSSSYISTLERTQPHSITGAVLRPEPDKVEKLAIALDKDVSEALRLAGYAPKNDLIEIPESVREALRGAKNLNENDMRLIAGIIRTMDKQKETE